MKIINSKKSIALAVATVISSSMVYATTPASTDYVDQKVTNTINYVDKQNVNMHNYIDQQDRNVIKYVDQQDKNVTKYIDQQDKNVLQYVDQQDKGVIRYVDQQNQNLSKYVDQQDANVTKFVKEQDELIRTDINRANKRIDDNFDLIQSNMDSIEKNKKDISVVNSRVDHNNNWLTKHEEQIQNHDLQLKNQEKRMTNQEKRIDGQDGRLNYLDNRVDNHDARIENHSKRIESHERRIEYNKELSNKALVEAQKHSTVTGGNNVTITESNNSNGGTNYEVNVNKVEFGNVKLNENGLNNGGKKVINVANGTISSTSTDAVNGGQLHEVISETNSQISNLNNRVSNLDNRINQVGASAAALAALHPQDFNPDDKWTLAIGYGNYKGAHEVAFGAFYRPNENLMLSLGATSEKMINAGLSVKLGHSDKLVGTSKLAMAKEMQDMKAQLNAQHKQIEMLVNMLLDNSEEKDTALGQISTVDEVKNRMRFSIDTVHEDDNVDKVERVHSNF